MFQQICLFFIFNILRVQIQYSLWICMFHSISDLNQHPTKPALDTKLDFGFYPNCTHYFRFCRQCWLYWQWFEWWMCCKNKYSIWMFWVMSSDSCLQGFSWASSGRNYCPKSCWMKSKMENKSVKNGVISGLARGK